MAGGSAVSSSGGESLGGKITLHVIICGIIAATGGFMFGYDIGISSGVTSMDDFLENIFPGVYAKKHLVKEDNYCKYVNQSLQLFTSSLSRRKSDTKGRKFTMQAASAFFIVGVIFTANT